VSSSAVTPRTVPRPTTDVDPHYLTHGRSQKGYGRQTRYGSLPLTHDPGVVSPGVVDGPLIGTLPKHVAAALSSGHTSLSHTTRNHHGQGESDSSVLGL
jgi:hypothetical protein